MSGSTIGGFAGAAIGFWFGGPAGARWGFMIGSAVGGYVDPDVIEGPRLNDGQTQTSNEGVPRTIIYGTACVAGNITQTGPLVEYKTSQRAGKGGPVQESFTYTRDVAIRICEAAPLGGTMMLRRVWKNDKLIYDASEANTIPADTAKFASILTFYSGAEDQLPDPTLEALPAENGGGVGNVPAYRGTCYAVLTGLDVTESGGAVPQFRWEVCSTGTEAEPVGPTIGAQTATATLGGSAFSAYIGHATEGVTFGSAADNLAVGGTITTGLYDDDLILASSSTYTNAGDLPTNPDFRVYMRAYSGNWGITNQADFGICALLLDGSFKADLRPTAAWPLAWWYNEGGYFPEYGGLIWFHQSSVYVGVRKTNDVVHNKIYRWPVEDAGGAIVEAEATSPQVTTGSTFYVHMDRAGAIRAIAENESELVTYNSDLTEESRVSLPMSLSNLRAFAVDSGTLILLRTATLYFYDLDTFTLQQSVVLTGTMSSVNNQIVCGDNSLFVKSGINLKRVSYAPSCYASAPLGWYAIPDTPDYFTDGMSLMPRCGAPLATVTPGMVALNGIVADLAGRVGVDTDQLDLQALSGIEVRGFPIARQTSAADAVRALQHVYFFEMPEWGNSGDTGTKLRAVLRGGSVTVTIDDDDLVDNDDDEGTRPQPVEFPRKVNLTASDPESNYEPITQPAERSTENVKAVGEASFSTNVVMTRTECSVVVDKLLKTLWEEATGRISRELPESFTGYTPSDRVSYLGKRWRLEKTELLEGSVKWDMVRDRASAYGSTATGSTAITPTTATSSIRGPTIFSVMNLPSLRSADNVPGLYLAAQGLLPGWVGADIYLSADGGVSEQKVATITDAAVMGEMAEACDADGADSAGLISVTILPGGELDSITEDQMDARMNGFAIITSGIAEIGQFQDATADSSGDTYDLTNVLRGQLGTDAAEHFSGDRFVLLDGTTVFLPLDVELAGKMLIFRAVSIGTAPANNPTTNIVFDPPVFIYDGGDSTT